MKYSYDMAFSLNRECIIREKENYKQAKETLEVLLQKEGVNLEVYTLEVFDSNENPVEGKENVFTFDMAICLNRPIVIEGKTYEEAEEKLKELVQKEGFDLDVYTLEVFDVNEEQVEE